VAALARVSGTTVSRVFGGREDESISPAAREKVLKAARELGYTPNSAAKMLRSGRNGLIGFWMCMLYSRYRAEVLARMRDVVADTEFALVVTDVDDDYAWHHSFERALRVPVEGIIAFDATLAAEAFAVDSERLAPNIPFVSMGAFWSESKSYVGVDLEAGAWEATDHLLARGRRRIAYVAPQASIFISGGARYEGYCRRLSEAGLEPVVLEVDDEPSRRVASFVEVLGACPAMPDALVCFYDDMAVDAVEALSALGLEAGRDVALVGFNGTEGVDRGPCPITTVRQPVEEMCALAFEILREQIENPGGPMRQVVLKPELIVRASSDFGF